ncbi:MAG: toll/interleukin-1 receptor domain-containing protein [Rubrivivax sp.]|nr:toll/interleukin-1 receptor domain-containing protein [Rubrivivax sp.]
MNHSANRVFISYRRDDAAGYAGRLEEALESRLGHGSVFRDVLDIPPGADFVAAIRERLAGAHTVLVLIGPRWAGGNAPGERRIDDDADFVRLEVATALDSGARVVPVLLPGAEMPAETDLPVLLRPLARRNALTLGDTHWGADIDRLVGTIGLPPRRRVWPWALGSAGIAAGAIAALCWLQPWAPSDPSARLLGSWQAEVKYGWGARHAERYEFKRHAGQLTGTASFLGHPRAIEKLEFDGSNLRFETRTQQTMGNETRELTHIYSAELRDRPPNERLAFRVQTSGAFDSRPPLEFEARRIDPAGLGP